MVGILAAVFNGVLGWGIGRGAEKAVEALVGQGPLHVSPYSEPEASRAFSIMVPERPEQLQSPQLENSGRAVLVWAQQHKGAAADSISYEVTVYGTVGHPLSIVGMHAEVERRLPAPAWTLFEPVGAGDLPQRPVDFDLDSDGARGVPAEDDSHGDWHFPLQVSDNEEERFFLTASTEKCDCTFTFVIEYKDDGKLKTANVPTGGEPLRVIASARAAAKMRWEISENVRFAAQ